MIELKAELMKKKKEYEESKKNPVFKASKRPLKETPLGADDNKAKIPQITAEDLKKSREALEAKSRLYKKLEKGKVMESELNASQRENLMVDFAWKGWNPETEDFEFSEDEEEKEECEGRYASNSGVGHGENGSKRLGIDQVLEMLNDSEDDDRWIEYEDEFGRFRVSKLSQIRQIQKDREEVNRLRSITVHYDGDAEIRNKGVAFYQFARDEEERRRQMAELNKSREETVERRMRTLIMKEQRRLRIESRLAKLKERRGK